MRGASHRAALPEGGNHAILLLLSRHLLLFQADPLEPSGWDALEDQAPDKCEGSDGCANAVVLHAEWVGAHVATTELDNDHLNTEGEENDANEHPVVEEVLEDVELMLTELTGVDLVEQLHEDEGLEHHSVAFNFHSWLVGHPTSFRVRCNLICIGIERIVVLILNAEDFSVLVHENKENNDLEDSLTENVSPHDFVDDSISLFGWLAVHEAVIGWLSGKSKSSKGVHNQVDPEELHGCERLFTKEAGAGKDKEHSDDVDSELELKELADVVVNVATV